MLKIRIAIGGKDITQTDEQGNARQMPFWERGLRVAGGVMGARQTINTEISLPNSITNRAVNKLSDIFDRPNFPPNPPFVLAVNNGLTFGSQAVNTARTLTIPNFTPPKINYPNGFGGVFKPTDTTRTDESGKSSL